MHYFQRLVENANHLAQEATGQLDDTKKLASKFDTVIKILKEQRDMDMMDAIMEFQDAMKDAESKEEREAAMREFDEWFVQDFKDALNMLIKTCTEVIASSKERNIRLQKALIWG